MRKTYRHTRTRSSFEHFVHGMGGVLNITGDYFCEVPEEPIILEPSEAIRGYWREVGGHIRTVDRRLASQHEPRPKQCAG